MPDENTVGREPIIIVEIDQDFCNNTYGSSPCTAAIGVTGSFKCYNTLTTCQDKANYDAGTLTLRFCSKTTKFPTPDTTELYIPIVESVSTNPTEVNIASANDDLLSLGKRASVTIVMRDIPYNDALVDNYLADRDFDPLSRSSFWAKWLARNEFYQNRPIRVREGYVGEAVASMRTRNYVIDRIDGVDSTGGVRIVAKDILKLADDKKAQAPAASGGSLIADITDAASSFEVDDGADYPTAQHVVRINDELITVTRSGNVFTVVERGHSNTTAAAHSADDSVQLCLVYSSERVEDIVEDLLVNYANISASFIDSAEWQQESETWLSNAILDTIITEPTGVTTLLAELAQQLVFYIWWDDVSQEIRFKAVKPVNQDTVTPVTEDANIIQDSFGISVKPEKRISQVWFYYAVNNYVDSLTDPANFNRLLVNVNTEKESAEEYGETKPLIIYSRWLDGNNASEALTTSSRLLTALQSNPTYFTFVVDAKDRDIDIGEVVSVTHRSLVDFQGNLSSTLMQVISREEIDSGHKVRYKCQKFGFVGRFGFIMPDTANDYGSATDEEKSTGAYISNSSGFMPDGTEGYKII